MEKLTPFDEIVR